MHLHVDDLSGLNLTHIRDMPVVHDAAHALALGREAVLSLAGRRHCQGGQDVITDGRMLLTTVSMNRIGPPKRVDGPTWDAEIDVEAGATWEELHRVLGPYGLAPAVQQSSAHFSIGGSISVNCHGRDPRWGPISQSITHLDVLTGRGEVLRASRSANADLFHAVVGGYGACGMILSARLRVVRNALLEYVGDVKRRNVSDYAKHVMQLGRHPEVQLHYAWLDCVPGRLYDEALIVDIKKADVPNEFLVQREFAEQSWGQDEVLRAGWSAARRHPGTMRRAVWNELRARHRHGNTDGGKGQKATRIDWLRAATSFTSHRGTDATDVLQEYFVPLDATLAMVKALRDIYLRHRINVLSTTLRLVQADDGTLMGYCNGAARVCIAVDASMGVSHAAGHAALADEPRAAIDACIRTALSMGGTYYLPYYRVADRALMQACYPGHPRMQAAIDNYNPRDKHGRRTFWSSFLQQYFG